MYNLYNTSKKRDTWRNSYEVQVAAREHDRRRFQNEDGVTFGKPHTTSKKKMRSTWKRIFEATGNLLAVLLG
jgi:hypothetical protein